MESDARPPPPPPPPPNMDLPPPPPPVAAVDPEKAAFIRDALSIATSTLEKGRCLETELEATMMMASSLLRHPPSTDSSVDVSSMPGGIRDAWAVLSDASVKPVAGEAAAAMPVSNNIIEAAKNDNELPLGKGQLGKAVHSKALSGCLSKAAGLAQQVQNQRTAQGAALKQALATAKSDPNYDLAWMEIFDDRLRQIQTYHARHHVREDQILRKRRKLGNPATDGYDLASTMAATITPVQQGVHFNEEEVMGKYLDLQPIFEEALQMLKQLTQPKHKDAFALPDFLAFLCKGSLSTTISEAAKLKERKRYVRFLGSLQTYLEGFVQRASPLLKVEKEVVAPAVEEFKKEWKGKGGVDGWEAKPADADMVDTSLDGGDENDDKPQGIDLSPYSSAAKLEKAVDGDRLKAELARLGLKCGGTVSDRAKRLFMTKDTPLDQLPKKLFAKQKTADSGAPGAPVTAKSERRVDIALREAIVAALLDHLRPTLEASLRRLERRLAQTLNERDQELDEELHGSSLDEETKTKENEGDDSDEDEDAPIYNPKGVPLGWDGKPIPYWLFKLHGLNHFYPCEICGESYRGRRNFEMHFTEAKHAYGMKCLGIPNTQHFHGVTKIEDAQKLWNSLQEKLDEEQFKEEEYEDSHGNVLSRAAYEDLARQGLL